MASQPDRSAIVRVRVRAIADVAAGVRALELVPIAGDALPIWTPGSHVDLHLPSGAVRQYSLSGDPTRLDSYRVAVLEVPDGRGGSAEVHRGIAEGDELNVGTPRNEFALATAPAHVFLAGGIGITPILPMVRELARSMQPWRVVYAARSADRFAFAEELDALAAASWGRVDYVASDTAGRLDLAELVRVSTGQQLYCCGPVPLMDALEAEMAAQGRGGQAVFERFSPAELLPEDGAESFEVVCEDSGITVDVTPDVSILDAVRAAGVDAPSSCEMGICGTCETRVVVGQIDHRDSLLTEAEQAAGDTMLICVSRAASPRLVVRL